MVLSNILIKMKIKLLTLTTLIIILINACSDPKADEKKMMEKVISMHDTVMVKSEKVMKYSSALDSVAKSKTDTAKIHTAITLNSQLKMADEAMMTWMHRFNPEFAGKSHAEIISYLNTQQTQVHRIDSLLSLAIKRSDKFLNTK